jgi:uncharacterized protein DUF222
VVTRADPMTAEEWEACLEHDLAEDLDPGDVQWEDEFLDSDANLTEAELAEIAGAMTARAAVAPGTAGAAAGADPAGVAAVLAESRRRAGDLITIADRLDAKLPGTKAALRDGTITLAKAQIIVNATAVLTAAEARAAEQLVLGRAGRLTPGSLREAIAQAVIEVAPARRRRGGSRRRSRRGWSGGARTPATAPWPAASSPGRGARRRPADHRLGPQPGFYEHNTPYEARGRTCLCNADPKCRRDHPAQTAPPMESQPAPRRNGPVDHVVRAKLHHRADPLPDLSRPRDHSGRGRYPGNRPCSLGLQLIPRPSRGMFPHS